MPKDNAVEAPKKPEKRSNIDVTKVQAGQVKVNQTIRMVVTGKVIGVSKGFAFDSNDKDNWRIELLNPKVTGITASNRADRELGEA